MITSSGYRGRLGQSGGINMKASFDEGGGVDRALDWVPRNLGSICGTATGG